MEPRTPPRSPAHPSTLHLTIDAMHCGACTGRVERALRDQDGVHSAAANLMARTVHVTYTAPASPHALLEALETAGYPAATLKTRYVIDGLGDAAQDNIIAQIGAIAGVIEVVQSHDTDESKGDSLSSPPNGAALTLTYAQGMTSPRELTRALNDILKDQGGLVAVAQGSQSPPPSPALRQQAEAAQLARDMAIASVLTLPVFVLAMGAHMIPAFHHWIMATMGERTSWVIQMGLTALVLIGPGRVFLRKGLPALLRGAPEMNSLVALGSLAAFGYSACVTILPDAFPIVSRGVYFEAAAMIVTLILLGRWMEARAKGQAGEAIAKLVELTPQTAQVERPSGVITLPVDDLVAGDIVHLAAGERVCLDGVIIDGDSWIDEAMLTGEPLPQRKTVGDQVTGGTLNGASAISFRVTATGAQTVLARIIAMVESAQGAKLPVQALVDRVTRVFVPTVIMLSLATFAIWLALGAQLAPALIAAISVMIIACPCAMGLATPVSILMGTGRAAQKGLLFRRGDALQRLSNVSTIAFDKTGTLTIGHPQITDCIGEPADITSALRLAAAAESRSEHPLARAIVDRARQSLTDAQGATGDAGAALPRARKVEALAGMGLRAQVEGKTVVIGNRRALEAENIAPRFIEDAERLAQAGKTPVWIAVEGEVLALLGLADPIKPEAREAVQRLQDAGITVTILSGDLQASAEAVAREIGLKDTDRNVIGGVLPEGKAAAITALKERGIVAFVGDGLNDAPALAQADIGIAIGTGTDIAIEAAEVVLMRGDPRGVADALALSKATMRNIRQNLFWAFAYNAALIPVAMGAFTPLGLHGISPMLAAGAMAFSSVFVVTNALRLRAA
ncbi:heavy metal translocating P-type ATPase [Albirhodobacter sp. R86504]|uniref:heavy metal translocating P-type ATPase n=1 Tax=Albirhodobacter sp. R86504 TaxID=3093848 RepID=UPI003670BAFC